MKKLAPAELKFQERLAALREERGLTQQALADMVGMHISQIRRYESGHSQPTLDAIRKLAAALSVSADLLLFKKDKRGPSVIESIVLRNTFKAAERCFSAVDSGGSSR